MNSLDGAFALQQHLNFFEPSILHLTILKVLSILISLLLLQTQSSQSLEKMSFFASWK